MISSAGQAHATAFTYEVYAPDRSGNTLTGWARLSRDCSGTYGCSNYIKIERRAWNGWQFLSGKWANNGGWNSVSGTMLSGCYDYRTTVDSYNDTLVSSGGGVNVGPVGISSSGQTIYRFRITWSSGYKRYCTSSGGGGW